jgi:energy-coupling factor transport system substrate-specific component
MRELFQMWGNTRMVVLTAICAALYAALLIPFKVIPLIPGITEFRPANAVPVVCSFLFGPLFGFFANLFYGLVPYLVWESLSDAEPVPRQASMFALGLPQFADLRILLVISLAATLCATVVGWGLHAIGFHPFRVLGSVVLVNNLVVATVLSPFLLAVLYPRVRKARLLYRDILGPRARPPRWRAWLGVLLVVGGTLGAFGAGQLIDNGRWLPPWIPYRTDTHALEVGLGLVPFLATAIVGLALL